MKLKKAKIVSKTLLSNLVRKYTIFILSLNSSIKNSRINNGIKKIFNNIVNSQVAYLLEGCENTKKTRKKFKDNLDIFIDKYVVVIPVVVYLALTGIYTYFGDYYSAGWSVYFHLNENISAVMILGLMSRYAFRTNSMIALYAMMAYKISLASTIMLGYSKAETDSQYFDYILSTENSLMFTGIIFVILMIIRKINR